MKITGDFTVKIRGDLVVDNLGDSVFERVLDLQERDTVFETDPFSSDGFMRVDYLSGCLLSFQKVLAREDGHDDIVFRNFFLGCQQHTAYTQVTALTGKIFPYLLVAKDMIKGDRDVNGNPDLAAVVDHSAFSRTGERNVWFW